MALQTIMIPTRTNTVGTADIPVTALPAGAVGVLVSLNTVDWTNPASRLTVLLELSRDGGVTWMGGGASDMQCGADGTFRDRTGAILPTVAMTFSWPGGATHLRGVLSIEGANIRTGGLVEVLA